MYRKRIERFPNCEITPWPGLENLREFMEKGYSFSFLSAPPKLKEKPIEVCNHPAEISIINIPGEGDASKFSVTHMKGACELSERLPSFAENSSSSQLIIVENICPKTLALLGGFYDIDVQFFAEHTGVVSWYQMNEIVPERLPALPSTRNAEDFLSLRYVSTRQLKETDNSSIRADSVTWPNMEQTRVGNTAGRLKPISAPNKTFLPMLFTRQGFSVWCKKKIDCQGWVGMCSTFGWLNYVLIITAIMLLDRPFPLKTKYGVLGLPEYVYSLSKSLCFRCLARNFCSLDMSEEE
jgi:hypothetical protein